MNRVAARRFNALRNLTKPQEFRAVYRLVTPFSKIYLKRLNNALRRRIMREESARVRGLVSTHLSAFLTCWVEPRFETTLFRNLAF